MMVEQGIIENYHYYLNFEGEVLRREKKLDYYDIQENENIIFFEKMVGGWKLS